MSRQNNRYSRFVAWVKIILPLVALALLSSLVLFSRSIDPEGAIPFAEVDVRELARDQVISAPTYTGVTSDGAAIVLSAKSARPDLAEPTRGLATELNARIDTPDGQRVNVTAQKGQIDTRGGVAELSGDVRVDTSSGFSLRTDAMRTALDRTDITSHGPVEGDGPPGTLSAGSMHLFEDETRPGTYVLVFQDGVKLVYQPQQ